MLITTNFSRAGNSFARFAAVPMLLHALLSMATLQAQAQAQELAPVLPPETAKVIESRAPVAKTTTVAAKQTSSAAPATTPSKPSTSPNRLSAADMIDAAIRDAGKIDRELRKDSPPPSEPAAPAAPPIPTRQQILEKSLAAPVVPHETKPGETTMEDITRPDGQRVTKVTGPNGTYCVTQISVGNTKGEDIIQRGAISRTTSCGSPF